MIQTVADLIAQLQQVDPKLPVFLSIETVRYGTLTIVKTKSAA
jgi:hypothetical protein